MAHRTRTTVAVAAITVTVGALVSCSASDPGAGAGSSVSTVADASAALWDSSSVHSLSIEYDQDDYDALIDAYLATGEKEWVSATVVIDGETFENAGLKLKGNSSLRGLSTDADAELSSQSPQDLPWIIRLDKYVDGQSLDGTTELVVRGNSSETALNEAIALDLLEAAGLASEQAIAVRFSAGGSEETLRLVIENPDDAWMERELGTGLLYKAEAGGDYSYRGEDPDAYADVFDQEGGDDDLAPLISFLEWLNESDDAEFAADLDEHLDVEAFATYLAFQDLVDNFDDIDGPGNNSYLYYDPDSGRMTVVNWDLNLAFGASPGGGGGAGGGRGGGQPPGGGDRERPDAPEAPDTPDGEAAGAQATTVAATRGGGSNVLSERFLADDDFRALYESASARLTADLVASGAATDILEAWTATLLSDAADLVPADTITEEADAIAAKLGS
jgi:spore coat protein CotH